MWKNLKETLTHNRPGLYCKRLGKKNRCEFKFLPDVINDNIMLEKCNYLIINRH